VKEGTMTLGRRVERLEHRQVDLSHCPPGACDLPPIALLTELPDGALVDDVTEQPAIEADWRCRRCGQPGTGISSIVTVMPPDESAA
jgi:hypothetical protein